jgi:DNA-directed RNA polymerase subunit L
LEICDRRSLFIISAVQIEEGNEPNEAVIKASNVLLVQLTQLRSNFEQEWELKKISGEDDAEY